MSIGERDVTELAGSIEQLLLDIGNALAGLDGSRACHGATNGFRAWRFAWLAGGSAHEANLRIITKWILCPFVASAHHD